MERANRLASNRAARQLILLILAGLYFLASSSGCSRWTSRRSSAFSSDTPTLSEVVGVANRNAERAQSLMARNLDITVHQKGHLTLPLDGQLALEKPRRFRLIAKNPLTGGCEADLGSNEDEFWFYVPHAAAPGERPALVHCSYENYGRVQANLPIQPDWIFESIGLTPLPNDSNQIIQPGRRGTVEIVSATTTPQGQPATILTVIQLESGYIVERHLRSRGQTIASATMSKHQTDQVTGVVYPGLIAINWPEAGVEVSMRLGGVEVNPVFADQQAQNLWRLPREVVATQPGQAGADDIDLGPDRRGSRNIPPSGGRLESQNRRDGFRPVDSSRQIRPAGTRSFIEE